LKDSAKKRKQKRRKEQQKRRTARAASRPAAEPDARTTYVRFGEPPEGGRSEFMGVMRGHWSNTARWGREEGVSCFEAKEEPDGSLLVLFRSGDPVKRKALRKIFDGFVRADDRALYELRGELVGRGVAGDPLLRDCEAREIPLTTAVRIGPPEDRLFEYVEGWNRWRYLDGTREGHRTPPMGENCLEAFAPPEARGVLHEDNEERWRRIWAGLEDAPDLARYFEEGDGD